jgi:hypothetical protein
MDEHPETDSDAVTGAERLLRVFQDMLLPGHGLLWAADRLLDLAAEGLVVRIARVASSDERPDAPPTYEFSDGLSTLETTATVVSRTFRSMLPRFAVLGAQEMGIDAPLYGGRVVITRDVGGRPVRLDVDFSNVLGCLRLQIVRASAPPHADNGSAHTSSAEPAAG